MKQFLKYFSVMIMVLVLSTGCGKDKDAKTILEEASANMKNVESMSMKMTMEMGIDVEGTTFSMDMVADMDMDKNENMHGTYTISMMGISEDVEMYITTKDGYEYTYMKPASSNEWQYTKEAVVNEEEETELTEEMNEMFDSMTDVKEVDSDKEGYTKLEVTVNMGKLNELMSEYEAGEDMPAFDSETDIKMNLYIKDGYICIMEIDMTELMKDMVEQDPETYGSVEYSTVKMTIEVGDFNKIDDITVPEEVVNSAKVAIGEE